MRKNTARHWLHAILDLLPVILIPVFMIYSHRHTMTQQTTVDIQYKYKSNEVNSVDDLVVDNVYNFNCQNTTMDSYLNSGIIRMKILKFYGYDLHNYNLDIDNSILTNYETNGDVSLVLSIDNYNSYFYIYLIDNPANNYLTSIYIGDLSSDDVSLNFDFQLLYLNNLYIYPNVISYTDYNEIESVEVNDETSSIMNVFMDNFNGAIAQYFNMGNVFGMTNVYQWFNTNIFGGNAPVVIYSVWNIVLYEFVMDLIFLLYALFMWFIDVTKRLVEKPLDSIK